MTKLRGAAANIMRPDKITPEERAAIIAMSKQMPTPAGDKAVAEKFGRAQITIAKIRMVWEKEAGIPTNRGLCGAPLGKYQKEPVRMNKALEFAKAYGKPFSTKTAAQYIGAHPGNGVMFQRLVKKGYFTTKTVKLHIRRRDGIQQRVSTLILFPTAKLFEE